MEEKKEGQGEKIDIIADTKESNSIQSDGTMTRTLPKKVVKKDRTRKLILTALFAALIAVGAFIKVQVGIVPFTLQMCFVSMAGLLLGGFYGGLSVLVYILLGLMGIPIFANGGGITYVMHPTFGYLVGMLIGGTVCGYISHSYGKITWTKMILGVLAMIVIVYICGLTHFYLVKTLYFEDAVTAHTLFVSCMLIFWPSDFLTCGLSIVVAKKLIPILERQGLMVSSEFYRRKQAKDEENMTQDEVASGIDNTKERE